MLKHTPTSLLLLMVLSRTASAQTVLLYSNDFETPNVPLMVNCPNSLDSRGINFLYGTATATFTQVNTVEALFINDPSGQYSNPEGIGGEYALGMLAAFQNDLLSLTFDAQGRDFLNVGLHLSSIDVLGCGGPFGVDVPVMQITLYDTPTGVFSFGAPGTMLDQATITGTAAPDQWTFAWTYDVAALDASGATAGPVTVVFDLLQSGYGVFDDLSIAASDTSGIVDRDTDGVADDSDNCPDDANTDQANQDMDLAGDVCDPAPTDPAICGDIDNDGTDDCAPPPMPDAGFVDSGARMDAQAPDSGATADAGAPPADAGFAADSGSARVDVGPPQNENPQDVADDGCGCAAVEARDNPLGAGVLVMAAVALLLRRRRFSSTRR